MAAPAVTYRLFRFRDPTSAPPWDDDPGLAASDGRDADWMIFRLQCTEGLSKITELELVLIRYEKLPEIPSRAENNDTIFDKLKKRVEHLRDTERAIDAAQQQWNRSRAGRSNSPTLSPSDQAAATAYKNAWQNFGKDAQDQAGNAWNDVTSIGDIEKDVLGMSDAPVDPYWNSGKPIDPGDYVGTVLSVMVARTGEDGAPTAGRWFTGVVSEFEDLGNVSSGYRVIRLLVVPTFWTLSLRTDCRIYQGLSAVEIIDDVLARAGVYQGSNALVWQPPSGVGAKEDWTPKREFCVQYNETDLDFVKRLLEEEGIAYCFEHRRGTERLVLLDAVDAAAGPRVQTATGEDEVPRRNRFEVASGLSVDHEFAWNLHPRKTVTPRRATLWDYNSSAYASPLEVISSAHPANAPVDSTAQEWPELYGYPAPVVMLPDESEPTRYKPHADQLASARFVLEAATHLDVSAAGHSNVMAMGAGRLVTLRDDEQDLPNLVGLTSPAACLLTSVTHHGFPADAHTGPGGRPTDIPEHVRGDEILQGEPESEYFNRFVCIPAAVPFRPARVTPKPRVDGLQTAIVLGNETQGQFPDDPTKDATNWIDVDKIGRVRVRFHWDRRDEAEEKSTRYEKARSCWVRVAQSWAGDGFGTMFIPRMGMEAVVSFEDGDPDRPLIVGCVYSRANAMPRERSHLDYRSKPNRLEIENEWPKDDGRLQYDESKQKLHVPDFDLNLIRTRSHPSLDSSEYRKDGVGFNELSFDDQSGRERIRLHAELDFHEIVSRNQSSEVQGDQMNVVHGDHTEEVYGTQTVTVEGTRHKGIKGSEKTHVVGDRTEVVKAHETIHVKNSRTEQVYERESITIGTGPEDDRLRKLTVNGNRHTRITQDDTLRVGQKEPPVPGAKTEVVTGKYGVKGATVAMNAKGKDPDDKPKSSIDIDADGNIDIEAHGDPGRFVLGTHGAEKEKGDTISYPVEITIDGRETVTLESLNPSGGGITLQCGDPVVKLTITGDRIAMEAPKEVIFSVGPTVMRMGEQSIVFACSDADADASDETAAMVAEDDATRQQSVYYFSLKTTGEITDETHTPPVEEEIIEDKPPAQADPKSHKELPGFYIHGDNFALGADAAVMIDGDKGVNVQSVDEANHEHHQRLRSKAEKDLYERYKELEKQRNDQILVVNDKQLKADEAEAAYKAQSARVDEKLAEIRAPGGPQETLDSAQEKLNKEARALHDAQDNVKRKQEKYDKAKAKNQVDVENLELNDAQSDLKLEQDRFDRVKKEYDEAFDDYLKVANELADENSKALAKRGEADKAQDELRAEKDKLDQLQTELDKVKRDYNRRAAYRENG